jgi:phosphoribosylamine--glycine ligase
MKVLVIGSGGREHTLVWKISQNPAVTKIYCAPGNAGISQIAECVKISADDINALAAFAEKENIGLTVVGPEIPLAAGIVDLFRQKKLAIFGPDKNAAQLESSKAFAKNLMQKYSIPTAAYRTFTDYNEAEKYLASLHVITPLVIKADGLAAGKGVIICQNTTFARTAITQVMKDKVFGASGNEAVIEEFLEGEEASVQIFLDGKHYSMMVAAQDHKRVLDKDLGPNTGGMGAYAPAPIVTSALKERVEKEIIQPLINGFIKEGIDYKGVLYLGLMIVSGKPYVLEFNCRFGDPETQVVLPLLKTDLIEIIEKINKGQLDKIKIEWYNKSALCVVLASGGYPGDYAKGKVIKGLEKAAQLKDVVVFHAGTACKDSQIVTSGGRVLGVTGLGNTIQDAKDAAYAAVRDISFEGMHYRKDIGYRALKHGK